MSYGDFAVALWDIANGLQYLCPEAGVLLRKEASRYCEAFRLPPPPKTKPREWMVWEGRDGSLHPIVEGTHYSVPCFRVRKVE